MTLCENCGKGIYYSPMKKRYIHLEGFNCGQPKPLKKYPPSHNERSIDRAILEHEATK